MKKYQLPKEFAEKWVSALRSGEYGQAKETLHENGTNNYCCLGAAAKICSVDEDIIDRYDVLDRGGDFERYGIPKELIKDSETMTFIDVLTSMNDGFECKQLSFPEIADWIELNVEFI